MLFLAQFALWAIQFFIGASIFSFLNVIVWRVPRGESFVSGRSHCTTCGRTLTALDMIPCISWLALRGKCRGCHEHISSRYFFIELFGGMCAVCSALRFGAFTGKAVLAFAVLGVLTVIALIDFDTMTIYDYSHIAVFALAVCAYFIFPEIGWKSRLLGCVVISLPMLLIALIVPGGFGGGDIKLMFVVGLLLGWRSTLCAFFIGVLTGGLYGAWLLITKKDMKGVHIAFGPYLCFGTAAAFFFGEALVNWYISILHF